MCLGGCAALLWVLLFPALTLAGPAPDEVVWLQRAASPLRTLDPRDTDYSDLQPLRRRLSGDVRVVLLGEATHSDGPTTRIKARLVRFLHEQLGCDVLAFEAPLFHTAAAEAALHRPDLPIDQALSLGLFGDAWRADDVIDLFSYVRSTYASAHPIRLAGIDPAFLYPHEYLVWLESTLARLAPGLIDRHLGVALAVAVERFPKTQKFHPLTSADRAADRDAFSRVLSGLEAVAGGPPADVADRQWCAQTLRSVLALYDWHAAVHADINPVIDWDAHPEANNVRDRAMADNLLWLARTRHPEAKIIVWAATFHAGRRLSTVDARFAALVGMGDPIAEALGRAAFVIGATARGGRWSPTDALPAPPARSWEMLTLARCPRSCVIDLTTPGMPGTLTRLSARPLGFDDHVADWGRVLDALVVIDAAEPEQLAN